MSILMLKLSNEKGQEDLLSGSDILAMYLGYFDMNGKVTYSTNVSVSQKPDYVLLILGNVTNICYLCHVEQYEFKGKGKKFIPEAEIFKKYAIDKYKDDKNVSWMLFKSMQKIPVDFLDEFGTGKIITEFARSRANSKIVK